METEKTEMIDTEFFFRKQNLNSMLQYQNSCGLNFFV